MEDSEESWPPVTNMVICVECSRAAAELYSQAVSLLQCMWRVMPKTNNDELCSRDENYVLRRPYVKGTREYDDVPHAMSTGTWTRGPHRFFFFLNSYFYPGWHPYGQAGCLSTTQVLKGSLLLESGKDEKEKQRRSFVTMSSGMN